MAKLLIVEDNKNLRTLYKEEFQREGYEVILAKDGTEAIQKMKNKNPDLVILEMKLPDMDGITAMSRMIQINKFLPIIINSDYCYYRDDFNTWGAKAYLIKSGNLTELKNKVAECITTIK